MKITYFGTTMLLLDDGTDQILLDAHVTRPPMVKMVFGRLATNEALAEKMINKFGMNRLRAVFISHTHHDHVMDAPYFVKRCGAVLYGSASACNVGRGGGLTEEQLVQFQAGQVYEVGRFRVTVLPAKHLKPNWFVKDIGKEITEPVVQPARRREYKEGGSYDFLVEHPDGESILYHPSFNYVAGALDGIHADVVFLGISGLGNATKEEKDAFFAETLAKVKPKRVVPVHWDNFMRPLTRDVKGMPIFLENTKKAFYEAETYCRAHNIIFQKMMPLTVVDDTDIGNAAGQQRQSAGNGK